MRVDPTHAGGFAAVRSVENGEYTDTYGIVDCIATPMAYVIDGLSQERALVIAAILNLAPADEAKHGG